MTFQAQASSRFTPFLYPASLCQQRLRSDRPGAPPANHTKSTRQFSDEANDSAVCLDTSGIRHLALPTQYKPGVPAHVVGMPPWSLKALARRAKDLRVASAILRCHRTTGHHQATASRTRGHTSPESKTDFCRINGAWMCRRNMHRLHSEPADKPFIAHAAKP